MCCASLQPSSTIAGTSTGMRFCAASSPWPAMIKTVSSTSGRLIQPPSRSSGDLRRLDTCRHWFCPATGTVDGCAPVGTFFRIFLPNLVTSLSAVATLRFLWCWNSLLLPVIFLRTDIPLPQLLTRISGTREINFDMRAVAAIITTAVPLLVFLLFQRHFAAGSLNRSGAKE